MPRRNSVNLKSFSPLRQSISLGIQGRRNSVAIRPDYNRRQSVATRDSPAKLPLTIRRKFSTPPACCYACLSERNPVASGAAPWKRIYHACMCPPHGLPGRWATAALVIIVTYLVLVVLTKDEALPSKCTYENITELNKYNLTDDNETDSLTADSLREMNKKCTGSIFGLYVIFVSALLAGALLKMCRLPPLLGMLVIGLMLRNIPGINVAANINKHWFSLLRNMALCVILTRAGLCLDPDTLRRLSAAVFRLAFVPCLTETCVDALASFLLLGFPIEWGFMLGFVLGAVSPAVVVLSMLKLEEQGYGVAKGIPTLVIAAASMDDVLSITGFSFALGIAFHSKESLALTIARGPLEALAGITYGVGLGVVLWYLPNKKNKRLVIFRAVLLICGGVVALLGSIQGHIPGAGALGCLTLSFVAGLGWRKRDDWTEEKNPVIPVVDTLWWLAEPLLFGLIGAEVDLSRLEISTVGYGLAVVCIGLIFRMVASFIVVLRVGLNLKEKMFIPFAWLPKATVQAAIGPVALDTAFQMSEINQESVQRGYQILTIAALVILITAPLGAGLIAILGPRLMERENMDIVIIDRDQNLLNVNQQLNSLERNQIGSDYCTSGNDIRSGSPIASSGNISDTDRDEMQDTATPLTNAVICIPEVLLGANGPPDEAEEDEEEKDDYLCSIYTLHGVRTKL